MPGCFLKPLWFLPLAPDVHWGLDASLQPSAFLVVAGATLPFFLCVVGEIEEVMVFLVYLLGKGQVHWYKTNQFWRL